MIGIIAAAALTAQPLAAAPHDDPDVRCMAAYLVVAGQTDEDPAAPVDKAGVNAIVMYFFGKIHARLPGLDVRAAIHTLVGSPAYLEADVARDLERCGAEALERGKTLEAFAADVESAPADVDNPVD